MGCLQVQLLLGGGQVLGVQGLVPGRGGHGGVLPRENPLQPRLPRRGLQGHPELRQGAGDVRDRRESAQHGAAGSRGRF